MSARECEPDGGGAGAGAEPPLPEDEGAGRERERVAYAQDRASGQPAPEGSSRKSGGEFAIYPSLEGRVILVTGGASGIGEAIVEAFAGQRARVLFLDVDDAAAERTLHGVRDAGCRRPFNRHCDLTDIDALRATVATLLTEFPRIDVLVNNAGNDARHSIADVNAGDVGQPDGGQPEAQFFMVQAVIPAMQAAGRGSIINMGSISWAIPSTGVPVYVTAKAGDRRTDAHAGA